MEGRLFIYAGSAGPTAGLECAHNPDGLVTSPPGILKDDYNKNNKNCQLLMLLPFFQLLSFITCKMEIVKA